MKKLSLVVFLFLFSHPPLFATTPHNLEGLKALNVLVIDKSNTISQQTKKKIYTALNKRLEENGILSKKEDIGTMFVKITSTKIDNRWVAYIQLGIGEEAVIERSGKVQSFVISYSIDDMVESEDIDAEVYDSVINFLINEFLEQYHEDNDE